MMVGAPARTAVYICWEKRIVWWNGCRRKKHRGGTGSGRCLRLVFVALLCFAGGAFSIMAFHNDISITDLFRQLYELVMGEKSSGCTILEMSYSIGLMVGIILFYNHIGKRRITQPTPIEVSMRGHVKGSDRSDDICLGGEESD